MSLESKRCKIFFAFACAIFLAANCPAYGTDFTWRLPVSGNATSFGNWLPSSFPPPGPSDTASFNLGSTGYTVSWPPNAPTGYQVGYLRVDNDTLTMNLGANNVYLTGYLAGPSVPDLSLGNSTGDIANLTLTNGTLMPGVTLGGGVGLGLDAIGYAAGSMATLTIDGSAGHATLQDDTQYIGYAGTGTVNVTNGGVLSSDRLFVGENGVGSVAITAGGALGSHDTVTVGDQVGSNGSITVDGVKSAVGGDPLMLIGESGTGSLSVTGGATVSASLTVGDKAGSQGTVTFDGKGSALSGDTDPIIGQYGTGSLSLTAGATASLHSLTVGDFTGSGSVHLDGKGTSVTVQSLTVIGQNGVGSLLLTGGATFSAGEMIVNGTGLAAPMATTPSGTVTVDGAGTSLSARELTIGGEFGTAALTVQNGGALVVQNKLSINQSGTDTPQLTFDGQGTTASVHGSMNVPPGVTVNIQDGAVVTTQTSMLEASGGLVQRGSVVVDGAGSQWNVTSLTLNGGSLSISNGGAVNAQTILQGFSTINVLSGASLAASSATLGPLTTVGSGATLTVPSLQVAGTLDLSGGGSVIVGALGPAAAGGVSPASAPLPIPGTLQIGAGGSFEAVSSTYGGMILGSLLNSGGMLTVDAGAPPLNRILTISGDFTQLPGGTTVLTAVGAPYNTSGELSVGGNVALAGVLELEFLAVKSFPLHVGQTFDLISAGGRFSTAGLTLDVVGVPAGFAYTTQLSDGVYSLTITTLPEPSTIVLAAFGVFAPGVPLATLIPLRQVRNH